MLYLVSYCLGHLVEEMSDCTSFFWGASISFRNYICSNAVRGKEADMKQYLSDQSATRVGLQTGWRDVALLVNIVLLAGGQERLLLFRIHDAESST